MRCTPAAVTHPALVAECRLLQLQQQPHCWGQSRSLPLDISVELWDCMAVVVLTAALLPCPCLLMGGHSWPAVGRAGRAVVTPRQVGVAIPKDRQSHR